MTLKDGSHFQDFYYAGDGYMRGVVWVGMRSDRERGRPEWRDVPMSMMPDDYLEKMRDEAGAALNRAAA